MQRLNLPEFDITLEQGKTLCLIRKKWVALTPEEWVRQHFIHLLIDQLNYPRGLLQLEHSFRYFKNAKRSDITVLDRDGNVFMVVECKSFREKLDQKVLDQIAAYNKILQSRYLTVTNGLNHFVWKSTLQGFEQLRNFPDFPKE
jgi:predicted type IV restriction endonuclease